MFRTHTNHFEIFFLENHTVLRYSANTGGEAVHSVTAFTRPIASNMPLFEVQVQQQFTMLPLNLLDPEGANGQVRDYLFPVFNISLQEHAHTAPRCQLASVYSNHKKERQKKQDDSTTIMK
jgi:hypothetical protein